MLYSNYCSQRGVESAQNNARSLFHTKGVTLEEIDGSTVENKLLRNSLFDLFCNTPNYKVYPQFFIKTSVSSIEEIDYRYLANWDTICKWNESDSIPGTSVYRGVSFSEQFSRFKAQRPSKE